MISASETDGIIATFESSGNRDNTLGVTVTVLEGETRIIDSNVQVFDPELSALNGGMGDFGGATLVIQRSGVANGDDVFSPSMPLNFNATEFFLSSDKKGTFTNLAGRIELTFDAGVTNDEVNQILQSLQYRNSSDVPPASVDLVWTFNDNNGGSQGDGGALEATGTSTFNFTPINDAPTITALDSNVAYTEDAAPVIIDNDVTLFDAELDASGNYDGATLHIARAVSASTEDVFGNSGLLGPLVQGTDLVYDGDIVGSTVLYAGGQLQLEFNSIATDDVINGVAQSITYANSSDAPPASVNLEWTFNDRSTSGGGSRFDVANIQVDITEVNDAPDINSGGLNPHFDDITEDDIDNGGELISDLLAKIGDPITDPDGPNAVEGIAVIINGENTVGTWQYSIDGGATWQDVGVVSNDSALLLGADDLLRLNPNGVAGGNANLGFRAWDQTSNDNAGDRIDIPGVGGISAFSSQTLSAQIAVLDVNDAPTVNLDSASFGIDYTTEFVLGGSPVSLTNSANIADVDNPIEQLTVTITDATSESIGAATFSNITRLDNPLLGVITFTNDGTATDQDFQDLLDSLTYSNTDTTATGSRTVTIVANDGFEDSVVATTTVNLTTDEIPVIDLNGNALGEDHSVNFTENSGPRTITSGAMVNDFGENDIVALTITANGFGATNPADSLIIDGQTVSAGVPFSHTFTTASGVMVDLFYDGNESFTFTNQAGATVPIPADELQTLVRSIQYLNTSDSLVDDTINFQFTLEDDASQASMATSTVNVNARNDAPVLDNTGLNTLTTIDEDSTNPAGDRVSDIIASSGLADGITDADDPLADEGIAIFFADSTNGTWEYSTDGTNWTGFGSPSSSAALLLSEDAYVRFRPNANFFGNASFSYHAWDQSSGTEGGIITLSGNTGGANPLSSDSDTAMITVNPVNDAPEVFVNSTSNTIMEDTTLTFSSAGGNAITIGDVDANGAEVALTIQVNDGVVSLGSTAGISNLMGDGTGSIALTGTIADINLALEGLTYDSDDNYHGTDQLTITVDDQGNTGDGGNLTEVANVAINITSVNDAPTVDLDSTNPADLDFSINYQAGSNSGVSVANGTIADIDNTIQTLVVTIVGFQPGESVFASALPPNITGPVTSGGGSTFTFSNDGNATNADFQTLLDSLEYVNFTSATGVSMLEFVANDGVEDSLVATTTVNIVPNIAPDSFDSTDNGNEDDASIAVTISGSDSDGTIIGYNILSLPTNGTLYHDAALTNSVSTGVLITTSTSVPLYFVPDADFNGIVDIEFAAIDDDGAHDATPGTTTIDITEVNDAPVVDDSGVLQLTGISEDDLNNNGNTVAEILDSDSSVDPITDVDGDPEGIAITNLTGNGTWQFNTGTGWTDVGSVSTTNALLLGESDRLRYVPDGENGETATILFHAWDQTDGGVSGTKVDPSVSGGTTAFSDQVEAATITVSDVNDAPTVDLDSTTVGRDYTTEFVAGTSPVAIVNVGNSSIADIDNPIEQLTVTLANFDATSETIDAATSNNITRTDVQPGVIAFINDGPADNDDFQILLDSLTYSNTDPTATGSRVVTIVANDGLDDSPVATTTVNIIANEIPVIDLNGSGVGIDRTNVTFSENSFARNIAMGSLVNDSMEGDIVTLTITANGFGATNDGDR